MKKFFGWVVVFVLLASLFINIQGVKAATTILHEFSYDTTNGRWPYKNLIYNSNKFFGMTHSGGANNAGTIFSIDTDGTDFTILYSFAGGNDDGENPYGSLVINGGKLYGTTYAGGDSDYGTIFSIDTDGSNFSLLHEFSGGGSDGRNPRGILVYDSNKLYGLSFYGGDEDSGTIFSIETNGANFSLLHEFTINTTGGYPANSLILYSGKLYGMTSTGGTNSGGTIFSIETNGSNFTLLHSFSTNASDCRNSAGNLLIIGNTLYGMAMYGGNFNNGAIFSVDTDGTDFALLHSFAGGVDDGRQPNGNSLITESGVLYGMTPTGGDYNRGVVFSIETDGDNFELLHEFDGSSGRTPFGDLLFHDNSLYGMTRDGGGSNLGIIFSTDLPISSGPTSIKNTLSNSAPGELVNMTIEYTTALTTAVTDGSVKLTLAEEFDFNGISKDDVSASGGDVTWDPNEIITVDGTIITRNNSWVDRVYAQGEDSIVFGFTGDLDNTGGTITFTINGATAPLNPGSIGSYDFNVGVFSTSDGTGAALEVRDGKVAIASQVNVTATVPSSLTFAIDGVSSGNACSNSGGNASVTTTGSTVPFGIYTGAQSKIACQTLTVSTNATNGYVVTVEQDQDLTSAGSDTMKAFSGTYATPTTWATPPGSGTESYFGFTTDDTGYSSFQTAKYAGFAADNTPYAIMTGPEPVVDEENVISYQLEVTNLQEAGIYSNTVMYIATATF